MCILAVVGLLHVWVLTYLLITFLKARLRAKGLGYQNEVLFWSIFMALFALAPVLCAIVFYSPEQQSLSYYSSCLSAAMFYACVLTRLWWNKRAASLQ